MRHESPLTPSPVGDDEAWLGVSTALYVPLFVGSVGWIAWRSGTGELWARFVGTDPIGWVALGLAGGALFAGCSQLVSARFPRMGAMSDALAVQLGPLSPGVTVALAVLSSVGEEWLFRGVLQPAWGIVPATLLFAVVHVPMQRELWLWPLMAGGIGVVLAMMFELSGGLVGPIALHFAINALNLRWLARRAAEIRQE